MITLHYFYIIILILDHTLMSLALGQTQRFKLTDKLTGCSRRLAKMIQNICNNEYKIVKRDTSFMMDKIIPEDLHAHMKRERLKRWRRTRRQVATECCDQPCTVRNILDYCPDDAEVLKENPGIV